MMAGNCYSAHTLSPMNADACRPRMRKHVRKQRPRMWLRAAHMRHLEHVEVEEEEVFFFCVVV